MQHKPRTLFMGTSDFAVEILQNLLKTVDVVGVVTQPDKPQGRKRQLQATPVAVFCETQGIDHVKPQSLIKEQSEIWDKFEPELVVVAAYGKMVPDLFLDKPKYKALNVHASLLPELRGAVPVHMAILQGCTQTGVTIQQMVADLDAGPIVAQAEYELTGMETTEFLMQKLAKLGTVTLQNVLFNYINNEVVPRPQEHSLATYCYQSDIAKDKAEITVNTPVDVAERMVRAFLPWPIAWVQIMVNGDVKRLKIFSSQIADRKVSQVEAPQLVKRNQKLFLKLRTGELQLWELQLEGKQRREAAQYLFLAD